MYLPKIIKLMEMRQSSNIIFHSFSLETIQFSTFVFSKVLRWDEWGEVANGYITYNFSHFAIYLPKIITIDGNFTKFWQKQFCTVFSETPCI